MKPGVIGRVIIALTLLQPFSASPVQAGSQDSFERFIETLEVGEPVYHENLTIIPVYSTRIQDRSRYVSLDEALRRNWLEVTELNGGNVPQASYGAVRTAARADRKFGGVC